jgi:hypothetical protein
MRIAAMAAMTMGVALAAGRIGPETPDTRNPERTATVCVEGHAGFTLSRAESIASEMFASIGVGIDWRPSLHDCPVEGIKISFSDVTPQALLPGALAYALPYEGTHVRVFYGRIQQLEPGSIPAVLAHVMVHEITHILQGVSRHADSGVMKAYWDHTDFSEMVRKPLPFTEEDVYLINKGLAARAKLAVKTGLVVAAR